MGQVAGGESCQQNKERRSTPAPKLGKEEILTFKEVHRLFLNMFKIYFMELDMRPKVTGRHF